MNRLRRSLLLLLLALLALAPAQVHARYYHHRGRSLGIVRRFTQYRQQQMVRLQQMMVQERIMEERIFLQQMQNHKQARAKLRADQEKDRQEEIKLMQEHKPVEVIIAPHSPTTSSVNKRK